MQSKIGKLVALCQGSSQEGQPTYSGTLPDHENIDLENWALVVGQLELKSPGTCLVEPTRGQNSARREHNTKRQHIDRRLIGEQEVGLDAARVIEYQQKFLRCFPTHPSMVETAFRNMA